MTGERKREAMAERLVLIIDSDTKGAVGGINDLKASTIALGTLLGNVYTKMLEVGAKAFRGIISEGKLAITSALEYEAAVNKLANTMSIAGEYTRENLEANMQFADSMEKTTNFTEEQILSAMALFKIYGVGQEKLQQATMAAADLTSVTGDLNTSTMLLAKANEGITMGLSRYGIKIEENLTETQKFDMALEQVGRRMGGLAKGEMQTMNGVIIDIGKTWGQMYKEIGLLITQSPAFQAAVKGVRDILKDLLVYVTENKNELGRFVKDGIIKAVEGMNLLFLATGTVVDAWKRLKIAMVESSIKQTQEEIRKEVIMSAALIGGKADERKKHIAELTEHLIKEKGELKELNKSYDEWIDKMAGVQDVIKGLEGKIKKAGTKPIELISSKGGDAIKEYSKEAIKATDITRSLAGTAAGMFAPAVTGVKSLSQAFTDVGNYILNTLIETALKVLITKLIIVSGLQAALTGISGGVFGLIPGLFASGGVVGGFGQVNPLPSAASGAMVASGRAVPIIAHEGEYVGTPARLQAAGIGGVNVTFTGDINTKTDFNEVARKIGKEISRARARIV